MMKTEEIPIPAEILEIIGERNITDFYDGDSLEENTDVELYHTNHKTFTIRSKAKNYKQRKAFLNHLNTFHHFHLSKDSKKPSGASQRTKKSAKVGSGCDSKESVSSSRKSQKLEIFSERAPVEVDGVTNSTPKKSVIPRRSVMVKAHRPEPSSSEDELESEHKMSPFNITQKANSVVSNRASETNIRKRKTSSGESDSSISDDDETPDHKQPLINKSCRVTNSKTFSSPSVESEDQKDSDSDDSENASKNQLSLHQTNAISDNGSTNSDEIIPATQLAHQESKNLNILVGNYGSSYDRKCDSYLTSSEGSKLDSSSKEPTKKNPSPFKAASSNDEIRSGSECIKLDPSSEEPVKKDSSSFKAASCNVQISKGRLSHSNSKPQENTSTLRKNFSSNSSDREDEKVFQKPLFTNEQSPSNMSRPLSNRSLSSDDSNSSDDDCSLKNSNESSPPRMVSKSQIPNKDSKDSDSSKKSDLVKNLSTRPIEKTPPPILIDKKTDEFSNHDSSDSRDISDSDKCDKKASTTPKSSPSCSSKSDQLRWGAANQHAEHLSHSSRKRRADSISSSSGDENKPKPKLRKTSGPHENVPFNSTRNSEIDEACFTVNDISMIPKVHQTSKVSSVEISVDNQKKSRVSPSKGLDLPRPGQLSILEFAKPLHSLSQSCQNAFEALKQEYCDAGYSSLKDFESFEGLVEEDLLDKDIEVYMVQCPKEVDPISLVGQKIDVSKTESIVELAVTGGKTVAHEIYCDSIDTGFDINLIVPSRTKKKFNLSAIPVSGRLTIVESVNVPQIDEFKSNSPPCVEFPENLRDRNTFLESDESTASLILRTSKTHKSRKAKRKDDRELASFISNTINAEKHEHIDDDETDGNKLKIRTKLEKDDVEIHGPSVSESLQSLDADCLEVNIKKKKKKKRHVENQQIGPSVSESLQRLDADCLEANIKKKKKRHVENQQIGVTMSVENDKEDLVAVPAESVTKKKKKKRKTLELEETYADALNAGEDEPSIKKKKKVKKEDAWMKAEYE